MKLCKRLRSVTARFRRTDYLYFGHSTVIDGRPYDRGFTQGFGPFMLHVHWKSKKLVEGDASLGPS